MDCSRKLGKYTFASLAGCVTRPWLLLLSSLPNTKEREPPDPPCLCEAVGRDVEVDRPKKDG